MVGAHGMDGSLVSYLAVQNSSFSDTNIVGRVLADDRGRDQVEALLQEQKRVAAAAARAHRHLVEALRDALLEREELIGSEITDVLDGRRTARGPRRRPARPPAVLPLGLSTPARGGPPGSATLDGVPSDAVSRAGRFALVLLLTVLLAVWGAFLVPLRVGGVPVPVGLLLALATVPLGLAGGRRARQPARRGRARARSGCSSG